MSVFYKYSVHIIVRVQAFIGLCMAMFFICKSHNVFAYDYGPSGIPASPTPVPTFITYGFDILSPDGNPSDWLNHDMLHIETNRTSSSFYQTIYKSNLIYALDSYFNIYPSNTYNSSMYENYIDEFMVAFDTYFPFDPHNPIYLINTFCNGNTIFFTIDLNYNSFDVDPETYYIYSNNSDYYVATSDKFISTFVGAKYNSNYTDYISFDYYPGTHFGIQNKSNYLYLCETNYFSYFSDLGFSSNYNPTSFRSILYGFRLNNNIPYFEGFHFNITNTTCPLVIFKPILSFDTFIFGTDPIEYTVKSNHNSSSYYTLYLNPNITSYSDFEWFFTLYEPIDWFNKIYRGLTYTNEFEPVPITPIPTFSVPFTPTPFPTNLFNPTVTPINLPLNPIIQIGDYGKPWDFISGIIPILHSALNSGTVHLFVQTIEYIYNTSLFFEVILFLIPSICLLAFILGRLKQK